MEERLAEMPSDPKNRAARADLRIKIDEEKDKIKAISPETDMVEYMSCIAKVIKEQDNKEEDIPLPKIDESAYEEKMVSTLGPIRPRMKKKKLIHNVPPGKTTMVSSRSILNYVNVQKDNQLEIREGIRLAQLMHEIPVDVEESKYCPVCPDKVVMEFIEKPPSLCCPMCGISRDTLDVNSAAVHDKETQVHIPFTYRPKQHFLQWIKRITGELKSNIPKEVL